MEKPDSGDYVWVIVHGKRKFVASDGRESPMYLGQFGWKGRSVEALQFPHKTEADLWITNASKNTPLLFLNADAQPLRIERPTNEKGTLQSEYDPFEGLNA